MGRRSPVDQEMVEEIVVTTLLGIILMVLVLGLIWLMGVVIWW